MGDISYSIYPKDRRPEAITPPPPYCLQLLALMFFFVAPPFFRTKKMVIDAFSDNSTRMWCNATGSSSFNLKWYHNSKRVFQTGTRIRINSDRSLSVFNLSWHDAGVYQCIAQNTAGQAITLTQLNVNSKYFFENFTVKFLLFGSIPLNLIHIKAYSVSFVCGSL